MPYRRTVVGVNALLLFTFVLASCTSVLSASNAWQARNNCHRIERLNRTTRAVLERSLTSLQKGEQDDDYRRFFGPDWETRKKLQIDNLEAQIARFGPVECSITILRWIEGAVT